MLDSLELDQYQHLVDQPITLHDGENQHAAVISEVSALTHQPEQSRAPFSVVIELADGEELQQGVYALEHNAHGKVDLMLVPIGRHNNRLQLEAVIA